MRHPPLCGFPFFFNPYVKPSATICVIRGFHSTVCRMYGSTPLRRGTLAVKSIDMQQRLTAEVERVAPPRLRGRAPEYRALRKLAERNRKAPPRTPTDALQHVVDVAREMTHATYSALAVTDDEDYVEGFVVSGFDDAALRALKVPPQGHGPLGSMRQDGLAVRLDDVARHAQAFGFPPKHPEM